KAVSEGFASALLEAAQESLDAAAEAALDQLF
ncbi:MAG: hypothetical protein RJA35_1281, partial [Actinomycetota bacterium]